MDKTFTLVLTADQAQELNLVLRKVSRESHGNYDECIGQISAALGAARYGTQCSLGETTADAAGNMTIDMTKVS